MNPVDRPPETPVFRISEILCPECFGKGQVVAANDREIDLVCSLCRHEWTAERPPTTVVSFNSPE